MQATKTITFSYGHRLSNYEGKCKMVHGHNGKLEVSVYRKNLDTTGFVIDFSDLKKELQKISDIFDHKTILNRNDDLNQKIATVLPDDWIVWFETNPTAENIAIYIGNVLSENIMCDSMVVKLWETDTSYVEYLRDNKI